MTSSVYVLNVTDVLCILQIYAYICSQVSRRTQRKSANKNINTLRCTLYIPYTTTSIYNTPYFEYILQIHAYNENLPISRCTIYVPNTTPYIYNTLYFEFVLQIYAYNENLHSLRCTLYIPNMTPYIYITPYILNMYCK